MRWMALLGAAGLALAGCGGSTSNDSGTGGGSGSGASAGSGTGGSAATGNVGGGGTGNYGGGGTGNVGNYGGGGTGNIGGGGTGGSPYCCKTDLDCPIGNAPGYESECIEGVCKPVPPQDTCWADRDCGGAHGSCVGASVCPCDMDCYAEDTLGKCIKFPGCCATDQDCPKDPKQPLTCVAGNCEPVPPSGQCWSDLDCNGGTCGGACICPCGVICACGGQMGWCTSTVPACCTGHAACGSGAVCANNVCKKSEPPYCWHDVECPAGQKCLGASVCPCGAACAVADSPGKCG
ncbi:MAG: hypothetical protein R3B13_34340 [Polyangiaceae bacterium]